MSPLLVILGPTATGKTKFALQVAKKFNGELVSADSRQVYKAMDIGTGKDLKNKFRIQNLEFRIKFRKKNYDLFAYDMEEVPIWMYDVVNIHEEFSVSHYHDLAQKVIDNISSRNKLPIIVGGTGLYISSLLKPPETIDIPRNNRLRAQLSTQSTEELSELLKKISFDVWNQMNLSDRANPRRLVRKIELADFYQKNPNASRNLTTSMYDVLCIGLKAPAVFLYEHIDRRVDKRVKQGIEKEIHSLIKRKSDWNLPALQALGYKEWNVPGQTTEQHIQKWKYDEHAYGRRQLTWFRKMSDIIWFSVDTDGWEHRALEEIKRWYTRSRYAK